MSAYVFDTECTGLKNPEIIQAASIKVGSQEPIIMDEVDPNQTVWYDENFKPSKPIEWGAVATHHILMSDLMNCRPSSEFRLPDDCVYLIGHNIDFDYNALPVRPVLRRICTNAIASHLYDGADSLSLVALCYQLYGGAIRHIAKDAHNALSDCVLTIYLLSRIIIELQCTSWHELWEISEKCRIPKRIGFGKHEGKLLSEVPHSYMQWYMRQDDLDKYLVDGFYQVMSGTYSPPSIKK